MNAKPALAALGISVLIALGTGCAEDEPLEEGVVAETTATEDSLIEPVVGADPLVEPAAGAAVAPVDFAAWDASRDGILDDNEFRTRFNEGAWYGEWDGDRNGMLSEEEFVAANTAWGDAPGGVDTNGLFDVWDADEDGLIDNDEAATGAFAAWDLDRNSTLDANEFNTGADWFAR